MVMLWQKPPSSFRSFAMDNTLFYVKVLRFPKHSDVVTVLCLPMNTHTHRRLEKGWH